MKGHAECVKFVKDLGLPLLLLGGGGYTSELLDARGGRERGGPAHREEAKRSKGGEELIGELG
jgi:hypothetical protein